MSTVRNQWVSAHHLGVLLLGVLLLAGCVAGEGARSVCRVDLGSASLRVVENDETITVADAADDDGVDAGLVFDKLDAGVVVRRDGDEVDVLALGRAEEVGGSWSFLEPAADCRLQNGPALRLGGYSGGSAVLDLDGTVLPLPAPQELVPGELTPVTATR